MKIDHLSASQLGTYSRCGMQYYYRYCEGRIVPPGIALVTGKAVHSVRSTDLSQKMTSGVNLPREQIADVASDQVDGAFREEVIIDGDLAGKSAKDVKGIVKDDVVAMSLLDYDTNLINLVPMAVEEKVEIPAGILPVKLIGYIDVRDQRNVIRDLKTAKRTPSIDEADKSLQLTTYSLLYRLTAGREENGVALDYLVKTKTPKALSLTSTRTKEDIQVLLNRMGRTITAIEKEVWIPAPVDSWICDPRYCGYASFCPYFTGRDRAAT